MTRQAHVDPLPHLEAVARAVMEGGQPEPAFRALDRAMGAVIGHTLFTVLLHFIRPEQERRRDRQPESALTSRGGAGRSREWPRGRRPAVAPAIGRPDCC